MKSPIFTKIFLFCFSMFVSNILSLHLNAEVYYVAVNGDDNHPGTIAEPFQTIPKALTVVQPGDTILIRQGTYPAFEVEDVQGTADNQIIIKAYPGEHVTIDREQPGSVERHVIHIIGTCKYLVFEDLEITDSDPIIDFLRTLNLWNDADYDTLLAYLDHLTEYRGGVRINLDTFAEYHNHLTFKNLEIHHLLGHGFQSSDGDHHQFINNHCYELGFPRSGYGFYVSGKHHLFKNNVIHVTVYGFHVQWADSSIFEGNVMHTNGNMPYYHLTSGGVKWYGGGLYIWNHGTGNIIRNNIGWGNDSAIRLAGCTDSWIVNNTLYDNTNGIYLKDGDGNSGVIIRNNIGYDNNNDFNIASGNIVDHNIDDNPQFVDADNRDFHLQSISPAIDAGIALPEVTDDKDGVSRPQGDDYDVGAYEYELIDHPVITNMLIINDSNLTITWPSVLDATGYNVYRGTTSDFEPDTSSGSNRIGTNVNDQDPGTSGVQWTDFDDVVGDLTTHYFYSVTCFGNESSPSEIWGEFDFNLITTATTDFNEIALPLSLQGVSKASDLMNTITGCNSVARWNADIQGYEQYVPGVEPTNFDVPMGHPYSVNITSSVVYTLLGKPVYTTFPLIVTPTTSFNAIMLTLDKTNITKASELMADIPNCNSVAYWNASIQGYEQYIPGIPPTDFDVMVGYPYYVNVTANGTWPNGGTLERISPETEITEADGSSAPHAVCGKIVTQGEDLDEGDLHFIAYIKSRPEEKLTEESPGCLLKNGYWIVQCGSFPSRWKMGESLNVAFGGEEGPKTEIEIELTYNPVDAAGEIVETEKKPVPTRWSLSQNYPNPFNSETIIRYQLSEPGHVFLRVYNIRGQELRTLVNEPKEAGFFTSTWDGKGNNGYLVDSGMYLYRIEVESEDQLLVKTYKMTMIR